MNIENREYKIRARKLDILVNKLMTSNWGILLLALAFSFFYWETASVQLLTVWIGAHVVITAGRALFVYPRYRKTTITSENVGRWLNWFTFTLGLTTSVWAIALPFFFVPGDANLLLVIMFAFFTLMVSGSITLASHLQGFIAFSIPLVVSVCSLFILGGDLVHIALSIAFLLFSGFNANFCKSLNRDITDLITLEIEKQELAEELERKNIIAEKSVDDKNRFLAAASHDLRQPLHASGLLLSTIKKHITSEEGTQILQEISNANMALTNSFNSLLDLSKLGAGVIEVNNRHVSLKETVNELAAEFATQVTEKKLQLIVAGPDTAVFTDGELLKRVFRNLISNSVNYTEAGSIEVAWEILDSESCVKISIADSGIGIPETELDKVFSEYYQLDNPERDRNKGFGLGLAIVKRLCDLLHINVHVNSSLGVGTTFEIKVQRGDLSKVVSLKDIQAELRDLSQLSVLVIDDDRAVLSSVRKLLESWGCRTLCAESAEQAISLLAANDPKPDLILADYRLRENRTGIEACKLVNDELNRDLPAIIITGDTSPDRLASVVKSGYSILHKPVSASDLRASIQRYLHV